MKGEPERGPVRRTNRRLRDEHRSLQAELEHEVTIAAGALSAA